jgi:phosphatidylglycerophosphatase A
MPLRLGATLFLIGEAAPFAPATAASFVMLPFLIPFMAMPLWGQLALTMAVIWVGILISTRAERYYGHDASAIVIDEVAGMLVTFLAIPSTAPLWPTLLGGFFLFRVFDVLKPFPAGRAQHLPAGQGVVMDDVMAGIYANLVLRVVLLFL